MKDNALCHWLGQDRDSIPSEQEIIEENLKMGWRAVSIKPKCDLWFAPVIYYAKDEEDEYGSYHVAPALYSKEENKWDIDFEGCHSDEERVVLWFPLVYELPWYYA